MHLWRQSLLMKKVEKSPSALCKWSCQQIVMLCNTIHWQRTQTNYPRRKHGHGKKRKEGRERKGREGKGKRRVGEKLVGRRSDRATVVYHESDGDLHSQTFEDAQTDRGCPWNLVRPPWLTNWLLGEYIGGNLVLLGTKKRVGLRSGS